MTMENHIWPAVGTLVGLGEEVRWFEKGSMNGDESSRFQSAFVHIALQTFPFIFILSGSLAENIC